MTVRRLQRSLDEPFPAPIWPFGTYLAAFDADQARTLHALLVVAYAEGGGMVTDFERWWQLLSEDPEYDPALCFILCTIDGTMIGAAQCWTSAFIKDLVVHPSWRRHGIGEALLRHVFTVFRDRGAAHVDLKVLSDNPTGAMRLYLRAGMSDAD